MGDFRIVRDCVETQDPTIGHLYAGDLDLCTLELPWKENAHNVSCIPDGKYQTVLCWSNRFEKVMPRLLNVPGRDGILIHPGNEMRNTNGCVLLGMQRSEDERIVTGSKIAFAVFYRWLAEELRGGPVFVEVSYGA